MNKKIIYLFVILSIAIGSIIIYLFTKKVIEITSGNPADYYIKDEYSGIVINKFIDKEQHDYRTVVIKQEDNEHTVIFSFVMGGLYEFIEKGDTLSKKSGTLDLQLKRKDLDTLITMQIYDRSKKVK
ncbi:MAG: hypothetical protein WDZ45_07985 [Flavobacteriaceae bacterium]